MYIAKWFLGERKLRTFLTVGKIKENLFYLIFSCFRSHFYEECYKKFSLIFLIFVLQKKQQTIKRLFNFLYNSILTSI